MPSPYSYDLRVRVVAAVERGMDVRAVSQTFGVHRDTITAWMARKDATGDVQAKTGYQRGHSHKISDRQQFKMFVDTHEDATVEELADAWGGVGRMTIWRQLQKLGYTHKKRPSAMLSGTKR
jgi:transposase